MDKSHQGKLQEEFKAQKIQATFNCEISCRGEVYGMFRADNTNARIWQRSDMDILITAAKTIALMLSDSGQRIEDLK